MRRAISATNPASMTWPRSTNASHKLLDLVLEELRIASASRWMILNASIRPSLSSLLHREPMEEVDASDVGGASRTMLGNAAHCRRRCGQPGDARPPPPASRPHGSRRGRRTVTRRWRRSATGNYDLLLLDLVMPNMNGYEVLSYLKSNPPPTTSFRCWSSPPRTTPPRSRTPSNWEPRTTSPSRSTRSSCKPAFHSCLENEALARPRGGATCTPFSARKSAPMTCSTSSFPPTSRPNSRRGERCDPAAR